MHRREIVIFAGLLAVLPAVSALADTVTIIQSNMTFDQEALTMHRGDKMIFRNQDKVNHNIIVVDPNGDAEDKGLQGPGEDTSETFKKPGVYKVRCNIHPDMKLTVTVR